MGSYMSVLFIYGVKYDPQNTQLRKNVVTTSLQRHDVAATLLRRCVFAGEPRKVKMCLQNIWMAYVQTNLRSSAILCLAHYFLDS